jgi:hypothetical protein
MTMLFDACSTLAHGVVPELVCADCPVCFVCVLRVCVCVFVCVRCAGSE